VFNFLAGAVPRAPGWMRQLELEWLHRLIVQPSRWRRQLSLPRFLALAALEAARRATSSNGVLTRGIGSFGRR
jgi:UDP-N-acetyl-D-mannosaminuronic acid transferase (WecB/TagA/CpsF family)